MKLNNKPIPLNEVTVVFPRQQGEDLVFKCGPVKDYSTFNTLCATPIPPTITKPGGESYPDLKDKKYVAAVEKHNEKRIQYLILNSLSATKNLTWDTVDVTNPETWAGFATELSESGLSDFESGKLVSACFEANSLNEDKLDAALKSFLAGQDQPTVS